MKFFEKIFGSAEENPVSDGGKYMAVPEHRGANDGDINIEDANIDAEIKRIENVIALFKATGNDGGQDIAFLTDKLENLKDRK